MSINTTSSVTVDPSAADIDVSTQRDLSVSTSCDVDLQIPESTVEGSKKEYSIVGDGLYASVSAESAPTWLTSLIDSVVTSSIAAGMLDYALLVQNVQNAIDAIDVAQNTYVEQINIDATINGIITSRLTTLNATFGDTYATKVELSTAVANSENATALDVTNLGVSFNNSLTSEVSDISLAFADADTALASDITALTTSFQDQNTSLSGHATAISGLQSHIGITDENYPNGTGMLSRVNILEKQADGVIEYSIDTYDVMLGVEDPNNNTGNDQLLVSVEPYTSWIAADTVSGTEETRASHVGDVYIQYSDDTNGTRTYVRSYKFIKTAADTTSPFSTDTEGYTWALITDTDAQSAYVIALNAQDLADSKRRVFVATPYGPYDIGDLWVDSSTAPSTIMKATVSRSTPNYLSSEWAVADEQASHFITNTYTPDSAQLHRQLDGKQEFYFYGSYSEVAGATDEATALATISSSWTTTELKDAAHGDTVYFQDTENAYWYQASTPAWLAVTDTSIYKALKDAASAQGTADGKVSQFYAWGHPTTAPYDIVEGTTTVADADSFKYWFKSDGIVYYKPSITWVTNPNVAEGDIVKVFDPVLSDYTMYTYNGTSWQQAGPTGIVSKSSFFVNLENDVTGSTGHVAGALASLKSSTDTYADNEGARVENKFSYDSTVILNGDHYNAGFGLNTSGVTDPPGADGTEGNEFNSEFWVDASKFVLKNPDYPSVSATFTVSDSGISLGVEHTEATRNTFQGGWAAETAYVPGDIVTYAGQSYSNLVGVDSTNTTAPAVGSTWALYAAKGDEGYTPVQGVDYFDGTGRYVSYIFRASTGTLSTPTNGSYDGYTETIPNNWSDDPVHVAGSITWVTKALYTQQLDANGNASTTWHRSDWSTPTKFYEKGEPGADADALTVATSTVAGVTTLTFSDGTTATVDDGANGTSSGVKIAYASDASGTSSSFTQGSRRYANYIEWTGSAPTSVPAGLTYTLFIGEDGDNAGVIPIYADSATGTNKTFTNSGKAYVNFYEWVDAAPTTPPSGLTYVKFIGDDGVDSTVPGPVGPTGSTGAGFYRYGSSTGTWPSNATANSYLLSVSGRAAVNDDVLTVYKTSDHTISSTRRYDGSSWVAAALLIDGDMIATGTIVGDRIAAGAVTADHIDSTAITASLITMDGNIEFFNEQSGVQFGKNSLGDTNPGAFFGRSGGVAGFNISSANSGIYADSNGTVALNSVRLYSGAAGVPQEYPNPGTYTTAISALTTSISVVIIGGGGGACNNATAGTSQGNIYKRAGTSGTASYIQWLGSSGNVISTYTGAGGNGTPASSVGSNTSYAAGAAGQASSKAPGGTGGTYGYNYSGTLPGNGAFGSGGGGAANGSTSSGTPNAPVNVAAAAGGTVSQLLSKPAGAVSIRIHVGSGGAGGQAFSSPIIYAGGDGGDGFVSYTDPNAGGIEIDLTDILNRLTALEA